MKGFLSLWMSVINASLNQRIDNENKVIPIKRMVDPLKIEKVANFMVTPGASYITGVKLSVDSEINQVLF